MHAIYPFTSNRRKKGEEGGVQKEEEGVGKGGGGRGEGGYPTNLSLFT